MVNWAKHGVLILLSIILLPFGGPILVYGLFFGWKYIKLLILIDIYTIYLLVRLPIFLFIQYPLHLLGVVTHGISSTFHTAFAKIHIHSKRYAALGIPVFLFFILFLFPVSISSPLSPGSWIANFQKLLASVFFSFFIVIVTAAISNFLSDKQIARGDLPGEVKVAGVGAAAAGTGAMAQGVKDTKEAMDKAQGVYNEIQTAGTEAEAAEAGSASALPADMEAVLGAIGEEVPFLGGILGAEGAGAAAGAEAAGGTAVAGLSASTAGAGIIVVILVLLILLIIMLVQWIIVIGYFFSVVSWFMPMIGGPILQALGLGESYANFAGQTVANKYLAGIDFSEEIRMYAQAKARVYCLMKGPSCLRQWRLNNTVRPGTKDVGEQYGLKIERFEVGSGSSLNTGLKKKDYALPVSFTISNPRHGLKGINAMNVSYRIKVIDFDHQGKNAFCDTGWIHNLQAYDIDSDGQRDDIYPGTSASTGFLTIRKDSSSGENLGAKEGLTLKECQMLQPGLGQRRTVVLQVKYNYFSQATLYFTAMARETLQTNPNIRKDWKPSETADTPVKAALNVYEPVLFNQRNRRRTSQSFGIRATVNSGSYGIKYRIRNLTVLNSRELDISDEQSCRFRPVKNGEQLWLKKPSRKRILNDKYWYTSSRKPPIFGCTMKLSEPEDISPSGETLTMGIKTNYTVALDDRLGSFKVYNARCSRVQCPTLVTRQFADWSENQGGEWGFVNNPSYWRTSCNGRDSGNGCSIVKGKKAWDNRKPPNNDLYKKYESSIEPGEIALDLPWSKDINRRQFKLGKNVEKTPRTWVIGLRKDQWKRIKKNERSFLIYDEKGSEPKFLALNNFCRKKSSNGEKLTDKEIYNRMKKQLENAKILAYRFNRAECEFSDKFSCKDLSMSVGGWAVCKTVKALI